MESESTSHGILHSGQGQIQNMLSLLSYRNNQQMKIEQKKEKINRLREALQMQVEEFMGYKLVNLNNIRKINCLNIGPVSKIQLLSEQISSVEGEKVGQESYTLKLSDPFRKIKSYLCRLRRYFRKR